MKLTLELSDEDDARIDEARGVLTFEAFVAKSAVEKAGVIIAMSTHAERHSGVVPRFAYSRRDA